HASRGEAVSITFDRRTYGSLAIYLPEGVPPPDEQPWLAYLLPADSATDPPTLTLDQSWTDYAGAYLFGIPTPAARERCIRDARVYLWGQVRGDPRFAWFRLPTGPYQAPSAELLLVERTESGFHTGPVALFPFRNVSLLVGKGLPITLEDNGF